MTKAVLALVLVCSLGPFALGCPGLTSEEGEHDPGAESSGDWETVGEVQSEIVDFAFDGAGNAVILMAQSSLNAGFHMSRDRGDGFERIGFGVEEHIRRVYPFMGANGELYVKLALVQPIGGSTQASIYPLHPDNETISSRRYVQIAQVGELWEVLWSDRNGNLYFADIDGDEPPVWMRSTQNNQVRELHMEPWTLLQESFAAAVSNFDGSMWFSIPGHGIWRIDRDGESTRQVLSCPSETLSIVCDGTPMGIPLLGHADGHVWVVLPDRFVLIDQASGEPLGELPASPSSDFPIPATLRAADAHDGAIYLHAKTALSENAPGALFKGTLDGGWVSKGELEGGYNYRLSPQKGHVYRWRDRAGAPLERWTP